MALRSIRLFPARGPVLAKVESAATNFRSMDDSGETMKLILHLGEPVSESQLSGINCGGCRHGLNALRHHVAIQHHRVPT